MYNKYGDMMSEEILDIFYNYIVREASTGRVSCFLDYSVLFNTYIVDAYEKHTCDVEIPHTLIPTLIIKNRERFNELLIRYVELCLSFYNEDNYLTEILDREEYDEHRTCPEKLIMTLLWSNATYEDFENPEEYLKKRIAFLESSVRETSLETDYSEFLSGKINLNIMKDNIHNETPYKMVIEMENDEGEKYTFPEVKFGIYNDQVYFYAIQNNSDNNSSYAKKINRLLFKVGEGFDASSDNYDIYNEGNLKDISASFLVALNIAINYLNSLGYQKLSASSILITRWNAKKVILDAKKSRNMINEKEEQELLDKQEIIQKNLTEKFLRTFLRLVHHYSNLEVSAYPFDIDSNLHLDITGELISNNTLLNETARLVKNDNKNLNL